MSLSKLKTIFFAVFIGGLTLAIILNPKESLEASTRGLSIWWEVVFPSLLPFFIVSELLIGFGVVKFIGVLLEPFMRPIFRVPGVGGFVWAMGMASGNPAGAKFTARIRQEEQITALEAERLVSFTSSSNPLFIFGAVAVGFFNDASLGILLAAAHYLGNLCVGLTMRFYGGTEQTTMAEKKATIFPSIKLALKELHATRIKESRPLGKMLGDAVMSSIQTLLMIGGFIILFSVFNKILAIIGVTEFLAIIFSGGLALLQLANELSIPLISGIFEITLGNRLVSETTVNLLDKVIIASFILAFGGLSIQAQVASILADTDIRFKPFFFSRILQGLYSAIIAFLLFKPLYLNLQSNLPNEIPVFLTYSPQWAKDYWEMIIQTGPLITIISLLVYIYLYARRNIFTKTLY
ncbi:sporulation integral membrane protein YlbJ [Metabacillus sediminilitoris]|uniref:Sporulation integral membrane protein YlbJ n=1 Tax=Metabacillus sediminilitoris TaxID=2567941 RepID=A0A4S4C792_9BACI|nr:sporulation integral membrane protein YlbJ [Metabacillus sediminilitoris]QGQ46966.1 sporulation integral membrane protein YlbJ [Metabacillus sediminilitoris]THF83115.1 sporulation integral membrane protein YlbJ [Metabacillus sediminilitoris]